MSNLLIRQLDPALQNRLREAAQQQGIPEAEYARALLNQALGVDAAASRADSPAGIEHIELVVDQGPKQEQSLREHTRVEYGDIKARFSSDASTKLLGLFTRYFPCDILDISVRGARIRSSKMLREQDPITLYFRYGRDEKVSIPARVVRITRDGGRGLEYGVQFRDVMPQGDLRSIICRKVIDQKFGH